MTDAPYRARAPASIEIAWSTEDDARRGCAELIAMLEREGAAVDLAAQVQLRPAALALADAEGDARIYVAWEIARAVNRILDASATARRLHRAGAESTEWLLLTHEEAEARRARGSSALSSPPPVLSPRERRSIALTLCGLLALGTFVATMCIAGEYVALGITVVAIIVGSQIGKRIAPEGASRARSAIAALLIDAPILVPVARLAWIGEYGLLALLLGALAIVAGAKRISTRSARAAA